MIRLVVLHLVLMLCLAGLPTPAQSDERPQVLPIPKSDVQQMDDPSARVTMARRLIRIRDYRGASALLESVYEVDPDNTIVQNLLLSCYLQLQYYVKAEILTRRLIDKAPSDVSRWLVLAEVLTDQGKRDEGQAAYRKTLSLIADEDHNMFSLIIRSMIVHNVEEVALELIDTARAKAGDPRLYASDRGSILEKRKEYLQAAREYLPSLVEDTTMSAQDAESKLLALLAFPESSPDVEKVLLAWAKERASVRILQLLSSHYLKANRFDDAFRFALQQDSLEGKKGQSLLQFMRQCQDRKEFSQVVRMGEYYLQEYPESQDACDVSFQYAEALGETGQTERAIAVYQRIAAAYPDSQKEADALLGVGWIYYHYLDDCRQALTYFDSVVTCQPRGMSYLKAQKLIPYCYLRLGKLKEAEEGFENLSRLKVNEDIAEEIDYNLALVKLFQKQYDSTEVALRRLMVDYPRGFYVNDALQLVLVLSEADEAEELLYDFSNMLFFEQRLMYDSARMQLERIAGADNKVLADVALFRLSELELNRGDTLEALAFIDRLSKEFPDSYYSPYGLKTRADVLALDADRQEDARALYRQLLKDHPNYPFISEVRKRLRELEKDGEVS